jgi:hypothetical protein
MAWPTNFAQLAGGNQPLSLFDTMFAQVAQMIAIPCVAGGQNSLTLAPIGNAPILAAYTEFCAFRFKAVQTSNAAMSANFLTLPNLPIYLADGATQAGLGVSILGQEYVLVFSQALNGGSGGFYIESAAVPATVITAGGSVNGLVITNNVATPTTQLDVSINEIVLNNAAGQSLRFTPGGAAFAGPINFGVNGVNGLDNGAINVNANYYLWAISNASLLRGLASLSATLSGLTFPSGYTYAKLIGVWRTLPATAVLYFGTQRGSRFQYQPGPATPQNILPAAVVGGATGGYTSQSLANVVPQTIMVRGTWLTLFIPVTSVASTGLFVAVAPNGNYAGLTPPLALDFPITFTAGQGNLGQKTVNGFLPTVGPVFWTANNSVWSLFVDGWEFSL